MSSLLSRILATTIQDMFSLAFVQVLWVLNIASSTPSAFFIFALHLFYSSSVFCWSAYCNAFFDFCPLLFLRFLNIFLCFHKLFSPSAFTWERECMFLGLVFLICIFWVFSLFCLALVSTDLFCGLNQIVNMHRQPTYAYNLGH